jgi:dsRNA-specific ribonuclease
MADPQELQWLQQLQSFLNTLLRHIIPDQTTRNRYLDRDAMIIWAKAFTHETFSPTANYEDLEFLGDAILKSVFPKYLMKRFPYFHKNEYTELNVAYMSKIMQATLSRKLGFSPYIRIKGLDKAILNLETDVFESFFGALDTISDNVLFGLGLANCYNMIVYIFKDIEIDEDRARGAAKTRVDQIFTRFGLPKPGQIIDNTNRFNIKVSVALPLESVKFLANYGVNIEGPTVRYEVIEKNPPAVRKYTGIVIAAKYAATSAEADFEAYTEAVNFLADRGITTEWAEEAKREVEFSDPLIAPYVGAAEQRLHAEGYKSMQIFIPRKTNTPKGAIIQLIGVRPNGRTELLSYTYSTDQDTRHRAAKGLIVEQYAKGIKV